MPTLRLLAAGAALAALSGFSGCGDPMSRAQEALKAGNYEEAASHLKEAVAKRQPGAARQLGFMFYEGPGVPEDRPRALMLLRLAEQEAGARGADAELNFALGNLYVQGKGVTQDYPEALERYRKAAQQGLPRAAYFAGLMLHEGRGVPQNKIEGRSWLEKAALAGDADAAGLMAQFKEGEDALKAGRDAREGRGRLQNYADALASYRKAAAAGEDAAWLGLGDLYEHGLGVDEDMVEAFVDYSKAEERDIPGAKDARRRVQNLMSPDQKNAALERAFGQ